MHELLYLSKGNLFVRMFMHCFIGLFINCLAPFPFVSDFNPQFIIDRS